MNSVRDEAFPPGEQRVLSTMEFWPGVEIHAVEGALTPGESALALRMFLVGEQRYAAGTLVVPEHRGGEFLLWLSAVINRDR